MMNTTKNKPITPQQLKALQTCFSRMGFDTEARHEFVSQFTDGRTQSSRELTFDEARNMLEKLNGNQSKQAEEKAKMIQQEARTVVGQIYGLSLKISFLNRDFNLETPEDFEMNKAKINVFARKSSACHKDMTKMTLEELKAFKKQLEAILHKEEKEL